VSLYHFCYLHSHVDNLLQYITWISDNKIAWTFMGAGVGADDIVQIAARPVPQEPMVFFYCDVLIVALTFINSISLSISEFRPTLVALIFSTSLSLQSCPSTTSAFINLVTPSTLAAIPATSRRRVISMRMYIWLIFSTVRALLMCASRYMEAYYNPNLTTWTNDFKQPMPKNKLLQSCN
jgi:hypothetical protein